MSVIRCPPLPNKYFKKTVWSSTIDLVLHVCITGESLVEKYTASCRGWYDDGLPAWEMGVWYGLYTIVKDSLGRTKMKKLTDSPEVRKCPSNTRLSMNDHQCNSMLQSLPVESTI